MTHPGIYAGFIFAQEASGGRSTFSLLLPLVIMGGLFYALFVMPQRRRRRKMETMRSEIAVGDEVRTIGGILGTIVAQTDDEYTIDIGGQNMRVVKQAIAEKLGDDSE